MELRKSLSLLTKIYSNIDVLSCSNQCSASKYQQSTMLFGLF